MMTMSEKICPHISIKKLVVNPYATLANITSGSILAALIQEFQSLLFDALLKIHIVDVITKSCSDALVTSVNKSSEIIRDRKADHTIDRIDINDYDDVKLVQQAGKAKKGGKKSGKGSSKEGKKNAEQERETQRKKDEEERLKKWNDDWEKKLKAQEALDEIPCCSAKGLSLRPKTQSNIWIKVTQDKKTQDIRMAFMHVPVPRPKPPPLPKLVKVETEKVPPPVPKKKKGSSGKKKGKGKNKK